MVTLGFVEWVALVVAVLGIVKVLTLLIKRDLWLNGVAKPILSSKLTPWVAGILTIVLFYYFLQHFNIIQIFALMGLFALLFDTILLTYKLPIVTWIKRFGNTGIKNGNKKIIIIHKNESCSLY